MEVYLVGGAVRDELLGLPVKERDWVVVGSSAEEMLSLGYRQVGRDFPVFLHPETGEEYALARTERKKGRGYYGFEVHASPDVSLQDDLLRRDLTINAMAKSQSGDIIDPHGGQSDLRARRLRHVSTAFVEDPLRILRVARFAARFARQGFDIADETMQLMHSMVGTGELREISTERIWDETLGALATDSPGVFFVTLHRLQALEQILGEVGCAFSVESARNSALLALEQISSSTDKPCVRLSSLVGGLYFHRRDEDTQGVSYLARQPGLPSACRELLELTVELQHACHGVFELNAEALLVLLRRLDERRRPERFVDLLQIFSVIFMSLEKENQYPQADWLQLASKRIEEIDVRQWISDGVRKGEVAGRLEHARLQLLQKMIDARALS
ncbi:MAG: multifunctional CCA tRNA nucleotidyl transferase/2'3'-cyclic phosphodiesterase/2'nucleotidase/phosphatase [Proteobacteria bacterium]|nr:multifunctional CCA tRNA nucleotidyl transferase/2'3'-cyclic phosphodiesterase/2'nucleotidase/phosphatase [Pseudomonadota bacterium]